MVYPLKDFQSEAIATAAKNIHLTEFFQRDCTGSPKKKVNMENYSVEENSRKKKKWGPVPKRKDVLVFVTGAYKKGKHEVGYGIVPYVKDNVQMKKKSPQNNWVGGESKERM